MNCLWKSGMTSYIVWLIVRPDEESRDNKRKFLRTSGVKYKACWWKKWNFIPVHVSKPQCFYTTNLVIIITDLSSLFKEKENNWRNFTQVRNIGKRTLDSFLYITNKLSYNPLLLNVNINYIEGITNYGHFNFWRTD